MDAEKQRAREQRRQKIADEILSTERSYTGFLKAIVTCWLKPLEEAADSSNTIIDHKQIKTLFSNIKSLYEFHLRFLASLEECAGNSADGSTGPAPSPTSAVKPGAYGALFHKFSPFFKMYTDYVNNHNEATILLDNLHNNANKFKKFAAFEAQAVLKEDCRGMGLASLLIMPVQRVPRYKLLLNELIKNTDNTHSDYAALENAFEGINMVARHINEALRHQQNVASIVELQSRFTQPVELIAPGRILVHEGIALKRNKKDDEKYYFILFTDLLCVADGNRERLRMHSMIPIDMSMNLQVKDEPAKDGSTLYLMDVHSSQKDLTMVWKEKKERDEWAELLYDAVRKEVQKQTSRLAHAESAGAMRYVFIAIV